MSVAGAPASYPFHWFLVDCRFRKDFVQQGEVAVCVAELACFGQDLVGDGGRGQWDSDKMASGE
jgi:hypothetical protein